MNDTFRRHVEQLHEKYEALVGMAPVTLDLLPKAVPPSGVYLFSEGGSHLYVGRSKQLRSRLRYHSSRAADDAPFAFKLARQETGHARATYSAKGSRKQLLADPVFRAAFERAKERIARMQIRFVEEPDAIRQALLEIYVAIVLRAPYNDFDTH